MLPLVAFAKAPLKVRHGEAGVVQVLESLPVGDMKMFAVFAASTTHV